MYEKMAEWPIKKLVISMSGPAVISMTVQGLYNVVDGFFLARLGQSVITAIAIAIPFFYIVFCIGIALGIDANSLISRRLGAKKIQEAGEVVEVTLLITCFLHEILSVHNEKRHLHHRKSYLLQIFFEFHHDNDRVAFGRDLS